MVGDEHSVSIKVEPTVQAIVIFTQLLLVATGRPERHLISFWTHINSYVNKSKQ